MKLFLKVFMLVIFAFSIFAFQSSNLETHEAVAREPHSYTSSGGVLCYNYLDEPCLAEIPDEDTEPTTGGPEPPR